MILADYDKSSYAFHYGDVEQVFLLDSCNDLNCNPTCTSGLLPGTRDESDDILVWLVVLVASLAAVLVLAAGALTFERAKYCVSGACCCSHKFPSMCVLMCTTSDSVGNRTVDDSPLLLGPIPTTHYAYFPPFSVGKHLREI